MTQGRIETFDGGVGFRRNLGPRRLAPDRGKHRQATGAFYGSRDQIGGTDIFGPVRMRITTTASGFQRRTGKA